MFCLPEGHWPNGNTAEEVGLKIFHEIQAYRQDNRYNSFRRLVLHADNCGGQNKNRYMAWLSALLVISGQCESIELKSLIAGHTKNCCDAVFRLAKRKLKQRDLITPSEMIAAIADI